MKRGLDLFLTFLVLASTVLVSAQALTEQEFYLQVQTISEVPVHPQLTIEMLLIQSEIGIEEAITFEQNGFPRTLNLQQLSMMREDRKNVFLSLLKSSKETEVESLEEIRVMPSGATKFGMPVGDYGFILENVEPVGVRLMGNLLTLGSIISFEGIYFGERASYGVTLVDFYFNSLMPTESWALVDVQVQALPDVGVEGEGEELLSSDEVTYLSTESCVDETPCDECCYSKQTKTEKDCNGNHRCIEQTHFALQKCLRACERAPPKDSSSEIQNTEQTESVISSGNNILESIIEARVESSEVRSRGSSVSSRGRTEALKEAKEEGTINGLQYLKAFVGFADEETEKVIEEVVQKKEFFIDEREIEEQVRALTILERFTLLLGVVTNVDEERKDNRPKIFSDGEIPAEYSNTKWCDDPTNKGDMDRGIDEIIHGTGPEDYGLPASTPDEEIKETLKDRLESSIVCTAKCENDAPCVPEIVVHKGEAEAKCVCGSAITPSPSISEAPLIETSEDAAFKCAAQTYSVQVDGKAESIGGTYKGGDCPSSRATATTECNKNVLSKAETAVLAQCKEKCQPIGELTCSPAPTVESKELCSSPASTSASPNNNKAGYWLQIIDGVKKCSARATGTGTFEGDCKCGGSGSTTSEGDGSDTPTPSSPGYSDDEGDCEGGACGVPNLVEDSADPESSDNGGDTPSPGIETTSCSYSVVVAGVNGPCASCGVVKDGLGKAGIPYGVDNSLSKQGCGNPVIYFIGSPKEKCPDYYMCKNDIYSVILYGRSPSETVGTILNVLNTKQQPKDFVRRVQ